MDPCLAIGYRLSVIEAGLLSSPCLSCSIPSSMSRFNTSRWR
ncbi:MAG: hypothetical protein ACK544_18515 [Microcystis sp.]|nr:MULTISPECIES: hypothetical protein [unclassified Microcystis]MCU7246030.1 hypothetical protein [Microcystis aeruginosa WS75]